MSVEFISNEVQVEGLAEIDEKLKALDYKVSQKIVRQALRAGSKVTLQSAKATVPVRTGALRKAIKVKAGRAKKGFASVLVTIGKQWFVGDEFYGAFVEFGHKVGSRKLSNRSEVAGEHFIEFAFEESKFTAVEMIVQTAKTLIEAAIAQQAKGAK